MGLQGHDIEFIEIYKDYEPPFPIIPYLQKTIRVVPVKYLKGLKSINLVEREGMSRERRRTRTKSRSKTLTLGEAGGCYVQKWEGRHAYVELYVDVKVPCDRVYNTWFQKQFTMDNLVSTMFHEIGHHIHYTKRPEHREKENVADDYMREFNRKWYRRQFPKYVVWLVLWSSKALLLNIVMPWKIPRPLKQLGALREALRLARSMQS